MLDALPPQTPQPVAMCLASAAERYGVPKLALYSIAAAEGGYPGLEVKNTNGTHDLGRMGINTTNLPDLTRYGITRAALLEDECTNVMVGAWKIARLLNAESGDWWRALARYNVGSLNTPGRVSAGYRYATKVVRYWTALSASR